LAFTARDLSVFDRQGLRPRAKYRANDTKPCGAPTTEKGHDSIMHESLLCELRSRRFSIRARWETLLRVEPITSPLGLPDALVHLIDSTLDEIFATLTRPGFRSRLAHSHPEAACSCRRNPYLAYFAAAAQALREGLILAQAASSHLDASERDASLAELNQLLDGISRREIESFCGVCQFRHLALPAPVQPLAICGR
jgi:hypothetical protein